MLSSAFRPVQKDIELVQPPPDSISRLEFSPTADILAVGSWDNNVRLYSVNSQGQSEPKAMYSHEAPVLDVTWNKTGSHCFSSGCDNAARMYDISTGTPQQVGAHDAPIKCVKYVEVNGQGMLCTAGWDKKVKYWDLRTPNAVATLELSDRAYAMDSAERLLVVATGDRKMYVYNLDQPQKEFKITESPLKWQTRVVSCFPTGDAYAVGSVEGRVGIQYVFMRKNYSFKCHRYDIPSGSMPGTPAAPSSQHVFAVNAITFHKVQGTFCTAGSDGSMTFWDGIARTKLKPYSPKDLNNGDTDARPPQWGLPIVSTSFNHNQEILAYALSYDWSKGHGGVPPAGSNSTRIMLHPVQKDEVAKKPKK
ncbi:mRNA export factor [Tremella mesenterica]|uniref:mRNA export factor n=1 Tax=Tremella mesenterica TaxID=5217 RepID=A0A4Q1BSP4_TREME|nr:mRNA export factor [Tremella mesenterica]